MKPSFILVLFWSLLVVFTIGCLQPSPLPGPDDPITINSAITQERIDLSNLANTIAEKCESGVVKRDDQRKMWDDGSAAIRDRTTNSVTTQFKKLFIDAEGLPETDAKEQETKYRAYARGWRAIAQEYKK